MELNYPLNTFEKLDTPFFYYDTGILNKTLDAINEATLNSGFQVHYAIKANANPRILKIIQEKGFGADCVSGNEVEAAFQAGFPNQKIVFAGVGKSDREINLSIDHDIACFNIESTQELDVINELSKAKNKISNIALRINPNVDAHTHHYITTGIEENKFGINLWELENLLEKLKSHTHVKLTGLHFHIGSQITDLDVFKGLCIRVNEIQEWFYTRRIIVDHVNVGGGLGVDYRHPDILPDFKAFFDIFKQNMLLRPHQKLHFELGRAMVAQSGSLIAKVLYIKEGVKTNFAILDAGMTELIRPALYQSVHRISNLSSTKDIVKYDVVGPICESSDCFGKAVLLPKTMRGDLIAIHSTGAYGEVMSSSYNLRDKAKAYYSDELNLRESI